MRKIFYFPYFLLIFFLFFILSISSKTTDKIREISISSIAPLNFFKKVSKTYPKNENGKNNLILENTLLKAQTEGVYEWLMFDQRIEEQFQKLKKLSNKPCDELYWKDFFRRRSEELKKILEIELQALPAKIIFREPSSWSSSIWINIGEKDNNALGRLIVGKNSPVIVNDSLVGVVEYVGKNESRVRLITDSGLVPSVRAVRGTTQDRSLIQIANALFERVHTRDDIFENQKEREIFFSLLSKMIDSLLKNKADYYLAKGELHGSSMPLWRGAGRKLKGIGFNYNYSDREGPERDLKTGKPLKKGFDFLDKAILKKGDLLVTSGMDGVFPAGLKVAVVSEIGDLEEGGYAYRIKAIPTALGIQDLNVVFVMPPLNFSKN
jgi:cell shape-determining protein MreC